MKIATNAPFSLPLISGVEYLHFGDRQDEAEVIVLLLTKHWGGAHIDKIQKFTDILSGYPPETPCFLAGCEMTIPDLNLRKYVMKERDDAIAALCDEVLRRSSTIGVRGEITLRYLHDVLGYDVGKLDLIYDPNAGADPEALEKFIDHNHSILKRFEKAIGEFQAKPNIFYDHPSSFDKLITIQSPTITHAGTSARLSADVVIDGEPKNIWCETSVDYAEYLLFERSDAFVCAVLPYAMRAGKDIVCEAPVTEEFLHNLNEILIPQLCAHDTRLYQTKILAGGDASTLSSRGAVGTGMSGGVDSFYTVSLYLKSKFPSMNLTHLYTGNYLYGNENAIYNRATDIANNLNLPLVTTGTNINEALKLPHVSTHFFKTLFGVLALRKLFKIYYYSSAEDFSHFSLKNNATSDTAIFELLLLYVFSCSDFQVITGGGKSERLEKTLAISEMETARRYLNVCLYPELDRNCGKCGKCMRTLLMLDMLEILDRFNDTFDVDEYRRTRVESFAYLLTQKNSIMLSPVYKHFLRTEPALMKAAEECRVT